MILIASISSGVTQKNEFDKIRKKWFEIIVGLPEGNDPQIRKDVEKYALQTENNAEKAIGKLNNEQNKKSYINYFK